MSLRKSLGLVLVLGASIFLSTSVLATTDLVERAIMISTPPMPRPCAAEPPPIRVDSLRRPANTVVAALTTKTDASEAPTTYAGPYRNDILFNGNLFTEQEFQQAISISGEVSCEDESQNPLFWQSAWVTDSFSISTDFHFLYEDNGRSRVPPNGKCYFKSALDLSKKIELDLSKISGLRPTDRRVVRGDDILKIALKKGQRVKGARPFPISDRQLVHGDSIMSFSFFSESSAAPFIRIGQVSEIASFPGRVGRDVISENIITVDGVSGGPVFGRDREGRLVVTAMPVSVKDTGDGATSYSRFAEVLASTYKALPPYAPLTR